MTSPTITTLGAVADLAGRPAYRWRRDLERFVHIGGPDIPDLDRCRARLAGHVLDGIDRAEGRR